MVEVVRHGHAKSFVGGGGFGHESGEMRGRAAVGEDKICCPRLGCRLFKCFNGHVLLCLCLQYYSLCEHLPG